MDDAVPTNIVDRELQGWWRGADGLYRADGVADALPIERVMSRWAPVRTIAPAPEVGLAIAQDAILVGGKHAAASIAAAADLIVTQLEILFQDRGVVDPRARAMSVINAADPQTERAALLVDMIAIGHRDTEVPSRVCAYTRDIVADLAISWIRGAGPFVDIAGALATMVSRVADEYGPQGWNHVADDWLQLGSLDSADSSTCYNLLYSASKFYTQTAAW